MNSTTITILDNHCVRTGRVSALPVSIDGQNGVDTLEFIVPESMADWAWRVEIEQNGKKTWRMMEDGHVWTVRAGEVVEGYGKIQAVASRQGGETTLCWKTREFDICVFPSINASEAVTPGEASALDEIAAQVKSDADRADAAAIRAEDAAAGAENIVNTAISDIEAEGQKQAAAVASSGTQALEAIGQVEQAAIAQVQAAGTAQVGAVEDAGDSKLAQIDAANAHAPQINEATGKWQVWDTQTGAYVDTDTDAQGPRGETGATGPQGPAGADGLGVPSPTAADAGKVPVVNAAGTGYELGAPIPEVDATLTEAGAPADAAAVGDAIEAITPDDESVGAKPWSSRHIVDMLCPPLEASGNPVQCYPVAGYPLGVKATWQPRQAGTGDPSPENVRPITGLDEVTVARSGKNLIHVTASEPLTSDGVAWTITDGVIHAQGTASVTSRYVAAENVFLPKGTYSVNPAQNIYYELVSGNSVIAQTQRSFTLKSDFTGNLQLFVLKGHTADVDIYPSIELGSTPTSYAPYTGTTATLSLPSTVYGGEVDLATGEGVETWNKYEFTGNEAFSINSQIQQNSQKNAYQCTIDVSDGFNVNALAVCNAFKYDIWSGVFVANSFSLVNNAGGVVIQTDGVQSVEEFTAYLSAQYSAGTPVTIAYKLATPQPIQATGSQSLPALSGENVLITNADSLTVTGRADPTHTMQTLSDRIAALEDEIAEGGTNA